MIKIYSTADGHSNVRYTVAGTLQGGESFLGPITDIKALAHSPKGLRLEKIFFALDKGFHCSLHWEDNEQSLILPLEDRGYFNFDDWFGGWSNPDRDGNTGNILLAIPTTDIGRTWAFALKIELTK